MKNRGTFLTGRGEVFEDRPKACLFRERAYREGRLAEEAPLRFEWLLSR